MEFEKEINELEGLEFSDDYIIKKGSVPILFTAVHTMKQKREDEVNPILDTLIKNDFNVK